MTSLPPLTRMFREILVWGLIGYRDLNSVLRIHLPTPPQPCILPFLCVLFLDRLSSQE